MIARTTAVIEPGGVLGELACAPPLTLRQVRGEDPERCELRLVGTEIGRASCRERVYSNV